MLYLSPPGGLSFEKVPRTPKESPRGQTYLPIRPAWGTAVTGDGIPSPAAWTVESKRETAEKFRVRNLQGGGGGARGRETVQDNDCTCGEGVSSR